MELLPALPASPFDSESINLDYFCDVLWDVVFPIQMQVNFPFLSVLTLFTTPTSSVPLNEESCWAISKGREESVTQLGGQRCTETSWGDGSQTP